MFDLFGNVTKDKSLKKHSQMESYSLFQRMGEEWHGKNENGTSLKRLISDRRVMFFFGIFIFIILILFGRLAWLQIFQGKYYLSVAEGNRIRIEEIKADRGLIFDNHGEQLVENLPDFYLSTIAAELPKDRVDFEQIVSKLQKVFPKNSEIIEKLEEIYNEENAYFTAEVLAQHLTLDQAISFRVLCQDCHGLYLKNRSRRNYLASDTLSHILGYLGLINPDELAQDEYYSYDDYIGKSGLELYYEKELRGEKGFKRVEVDSRGRENKVLNKQDAEIGNSLNLTIDLDLQQEFYQIFENELSKLETNRAVGIMMNPQNGEILSLVSYPNYDNNLFVSGISVEDYQNLINDPDKPMFFRAISGEYPPGSTIKPLVALAALEEGVVTRWTEFNSTGGLRIDKWYFPDWKYGGHGRVNVKEAIADSVNTYFYYIGGGYEDFEGLGVARIKKYLEQFNLGQPTGIDLYGEGSGFIPSRQWKEETKKENWYVGDTYHLAIGQGDILVTPLQVAAFTSMIANGGKIYQPRLVDSISNPDFDGYMKIEDKIIKRADVDPQNLKVIQEAMHDTVTYGSGVSLSTLPFSSAGKTGTAQAGGDRENHAWYTGFAPFENPEVVVTVLVENGGAGDKVAVPIAKQILDYYFSKKD